MNQINQVQHYKNFFPLEKPGNITFFISFLEGLYGHTFDDIKFVTSED
jgi:hypothetical protein